MKKLAVLLLVLAMVLSLSFVSYAADEAEDPYADLDPIVLQNADGGTIEEISTIYNGKFCDMVTERSGGKLTIEWYPAGQLGSLVESMEAISIGTMDLAKVDPSLMGEYSPITKLLTLPFLIKDYEHGAKVLNGEVGAMIAEQIEKDSGIKVLGWEFVGFRNFCTKTPIRSVADCKDILLRSPEAQIYMDTFNLLGMQPTPIPYGEMYTAMQTGVVDGVETTPEVIYTSEFYKLGKYICASNHMFTVNFIGINANLFYSLPQAYQDLLVSCAQECVEGEQAEILENADKWYAKLEEGGAEITEFENYQELIDLYSDYWAQTSASIGGNAQESIESINGLPELFAKETIHR